MKYILISLLLFTIASMFAAPVFNTPVELTQPDGTKIQALASGDEFHNWLHDKDHYTIIQNPNTGWYTYAVKNGEGVAPSSFIAGRIDPKSAGLVPNINVSDEIVKAKRDEFERKTLEHGGYIKAPHTGTLNNIVVFIRFAGEPEFSETIYGFDYMFNSHAPDANSMYHYYQVASYGQLAIDSYYYPSSPDSFIVSYQDSHPRGYYQPYNEMNHIGYTGGDDGDVRTEREHNLLLAATNAIAVQVPTTLNIDGDNDGYVDNVCYIVKGSPTGWASLLWPHRWVLYSVDAEINGKRVWDFNLQLQSMTYSSGAGVLSHEMFHTLGSPDLYRYTNTNIEPIGAWDLMSNDHNPPQFMAVYMKYKYGQWLTDIPTITTSGTYTLNPNQSLDNSIYKIPSYSPTEYFVVEYRNQEGMFDSVPGKGLVVYRVNTDESGNASGPPDEFYIYRPGGTLNMTGMINSAAFNAESGRTFINDSSNPSSFLSDGSPGGLDISNVGTAGETISFDVRISNIQVMNPNGGEVWFYGAPKTITWSAMNHNGNVKIEFSTDNGGNWSTVISSTPNTGSYNWSFVPNLYSTNCLIRITHLTQGWVDESNHPFSILNNVPIPLLGSPANGASSVPTSVLLTWDATVGAICYQLQVASDEQFSHLVIDEVDIADHYYTTFSLSPFTTYYWHVCSVSEIGPSECSITRSFTTGQISVVPAVPVMLAPVNLITGLPNNPVFSWNASYQADAYELEVAYDYFFTQLVVNEESLTDTMFQATNLAPNSTYYWRIRSHNIVGWSYFTLIRSFQTGNYTANQDHVITAITKNDLLPNYPNPFNPETTIAFAVKAKAKVKLEIYNVLGQKVTTLLNSNMDPGMHKLTWNGTNANGYKVSSGIYWARMNIGNDTFTMKMLLLK
ncbi:MAG TPA: M6 family metalloprotease domain-containing protein [Candidatus Cloacimonadota bacterium]|nr:M6 family metalloprotease domain-containing protein [Candidatus Cloacimonadota bacterium]HPT72682.1 M6 family metalloprotease domain-containing protein [Candidatus Cloacimonadota bacterium]